MSKLDEVLKHHGVKGMKWGVHKSQFRERVDANASKATEGIVKRLGSDINMARYFTRGHIRRSRVKFDDNWYKHLDTGKQFIEKGATLNRVVRGVDENVLAGRLYVSSVKTMLRCTEQPYLISRKQVLVVRNRIIQCTNLNSKPNND
jgi:hypothetical protein